MMMMMIMMAFVVAGPHRNFLLLSCLYLPRLHIHIQTAHLAVTDASFVYTHFFAFGFLFAFETVFKGYPVPNEWVALFEAAAKSAQLDPEKIRKDAEV